MVSRETKIQLGAVGIASILLAAVSWLVPALLTRPWGALVIASAYVIAVGGSHVYLAIRGDGTGVPASARWRFVAVFVLLIVLWAIAMTADEAHVATQSVRQLAGYGGALLFSAYFVYEAVSGYRDWKACS